MMKAKELWFSTQVLLKFYGLWPLESNTSELLRTQFVTANHLEATTKVQRSKQLLFIWLLVICIVVHCWKISQRPRGQSSKGPREKRSEGPREQRSKLQHWLCTGGVHANCIDCWLNLIPNVEAFGLFEGAEVLSLWSSILYLFKDQDLVTGLTGSYERLVVAGLAVPGKAVVTDALVVVPHVIVLTRGEHGTEVVLIRALFSLTLSL